VLLAKIGTSVGLLAVLFSRMDVAALVFRARNASFPWLVVAFVLYGVHILANSWRWRLLLQVQRIYLSIRTLVGSYLVASFLGNFLPSNIGGDVVRIRDTARAAGSKTLATTVILMDRGIGLMGLTLLAALGATVATATSPMPPAWLWAVFLVGAAAAAPAVLAPAGFGRLLQPLTIVHPEWVGTRLNTLTAALGRFRDRPGALAACFGGAVLVQSILVLYYLAVAVALDLEVGVWHLAVIVPISFVVQMLPISVNGFGVREATFSFYFARLGLPLESAVLLSLVATAVIMAFSLTGAAVYVVRGRAGETLEIAEHDR
jgi:uncharacterized membrane protein YbhN (UPF0104 family)